MFELYLNIWSEQVADFYISAPHWLTLPGIVYYHSRQLETGSAIYLISVAIYKYHMYL